MVRDILTFALIGACSVLIFLSFVTDAISRRRKVALLFMTVSAILLLGSGTLAYRLDGNPNSIVFYVIRISKFFAYEAYIQVLYFFNMYLVDLFLNEGQLETEPKRLKYTKYILWFDVGILVISQFCGLYYTYNENNVYHRENGYVISYVCPIVVLIIQLSVIIQNRNKFRKRLRIPLTLFATMPLCTSTIQYFKGGVSYTGSAVVGMVILLFYFSTLDANRYIKIAHKRELYALQEKEEYIRALISQTSLALVEAIDAKDNYTNGHSKRVAEYSCMIASEAGMSKEECNEIYLMGILHDVGKIGVDDSIINKVGKLTDEEYEKMKEHPSIGKEILEKISLDPNLQIGAHYHHERYDGKGYPEGLKEDEIPLMARIIAVADSYDAMTSKRSYRDALPQDVVREEIRKGAGSQFDPVYAAIMLKLMDEDTDYQLRQI